MEKLMYGQYNYYGKNSSSSDGIAVECIFRETNAMKRNIGKGFIITYSMHLAQFLLSMIYLSYGNSQILPCYLLGFYLGQGE